MTTSLFFRPANAHLDRLEAEAIGILREVAGQNASPVLLFSGGKSSLCLLRLAEKAFRPERFPFPLLHFDTGNNFPDVLAFRDWRVAELGERLIVRSAGNPLLRPATLRKAIEEHGFDACISGARHAEEAGAKPLSNWSELDVWWYIEREQLELPSIYFAQRRSVVHRNGLLQPVTALTPAQEGDVVETMRVRFPSLDEIPYAVPVASEADSVVGIIEEMATNAIAKHKAVGFDEHCAPPGESFASLAYA